MTRIRHTWLQTRITNLRSLGGRGAVSGVPSSRGRACTWKEGRGP